MRITIDETLLYDILDVKRAKQQGLVSLTNRVFRINTNQCICIPRELYYMLLDSISEYVVLQVGQYSLSILYEDLAYWPTVFIEDRTDIELQSLGEWVEVEG